MINATAAIISPMLGRLFLKSYWVPTAICMASLVNPVHLLADGGGKIPYTGILAGSIIMTPTSILSDVHEVSSALGRGTQVFTSVEVTGFFDHVLTTSTAFAANGDAIFITSELFGKFTPPSEIVYTGTYEITGGTGRFDFDASCGGLDFGSGEISGAATVEYADGGEVIILTFSNTFFGDICRPVGRRSSSNDQ